MQFDEFSWINRQRCEAPDGFNHPLASWSLSDWLTAVAEELGEAAGNVKRLNRLRDGLIANPPPQAAEKLQAKLKREIADTFIYLDLLAQAAGVRMSEAVAETFNAKSAEIGCSIRIELPTAARPEAIPKAVMTDNENAVQLAHMLGHAAAAAGLPPIAVVAAENLFKAIRDVPTCRSVMREWLARLEDSSC